MKNWISISGWREIKTVWANIYHVLAATILLNFLTNSAASGAEADTTDAAEAPSMELLEFLGEFQTEDRQWIDPLKLVASERSDKSTQSAPRPDDEDKPDE